MLPIFNLETNSYTLLLIVLALAAFALALVVCFSLRALLKGLQEVRGVLMLLGCLTLFAPYAINTYTQITIFNTYYNYLVVTFVEWFLIMVYVLGFACSTWIEPRPSTLAQKPNENHRKSRSMESFPIAIAVSAFCIIFSAFALGLVAKAALDLAAGPQYKTGVIEHTSLPLGRTYVQNGRIVIEGITFETPDLSWFNSLSTGQTVKVAYSSLTEFAFAPDRIAFTPIVALPLVIILAPAILLIGFAVHRTFFKG